MTKARKDFHRSFSELIHRSVLMMPRSMKRLIMVAVDAVMIPLALLTAYALRLGSWFPDVIHLSWLFALSVLIALPSFQFFGLYRAVVRYIGLQALAAVLKGVSVTAVSLAALAYMFPIEGVVPRSMFVIFWMIAVLYAGGTRFLIRGYFHWLTQSYLSRDNIAIYGAGSSGIQVAKAFGASHECYVAAFIDDNPKLIGHSVNGIRVYDSKDLGELISSLEIRQILLALPSAGKSTRKKILQRLEHLPVRVRTVPGLDDLLSGNAGVQDIRDVDVEDLLGRDSVPPDSQLMEKCIADKQVLVTGAGGSIGSELCRQIIKARPRCLVLYELSEYALYKIDQELAALNQQLQVKVDIVPILGSVQDQPRLEATMKHFAIDTVYHAAAYKHVPLVEHNLIEGIKNNVFGTYAAARSAQRVGVKTFVLVSTDKAVRPTNIMGASKRLAELILLGLSSTQQNDETRFCMVRFGNVLGSSGSVVPRFRQQIQNGQSVTVTHPEMIRYFMTIPEAAQLVIQAGAMSSSGDIFVLDMGEPVRILDLALKMIRLMGEEPKTKENPSGTIAVNFSGLRPGEKLFEELLIGSNVSGTGHSKILRADEPEVALDDVNHMLEQLRAAVVAYDSDRIKALLMTWVDGYTTTSEFDDIQISNNLHRRLPAKSVVTKLY